MDSDHRRALGRNWQSADENGHNQPQKMKFRELLVLLPYPFVDHLPLRQDEATAQQLLSGHCALWHPALLNCARSLPDWVFAAEPPEELEGKLLLLPEYSVPLLPEGWTDRAENSGACVIRDFDNRDQIIATALERLDGNSSQIEPDLVADFMALGLCYFYVELLMRRLRYTSSLDQEAFLAEVLAAADHAIASATRAARQRIQAAFDLLHDTRHFYYPVELHLLDLTLVASTTIGPSLRNELAVGQPVNLMISGELVDQMSREEPETLRALAETLEAGTAAMIGGEFTEGPLAMVSPEAMRRQLVRGLASYREHLDAQPSMFGRRRFGLSPMLPQVLRALEFTGAFHCTLDGGRFPLGKQSRVEWEGIDGTGLDTLARAPLDVSGAAVFLSLPETLSETMDLHHVATLVLAHWPGQASPWYEDLRRIASYSPVLGRFFTIGEYLAETSAVGLRVAYRNDQYRTPYLRQAVSSSEVDPISRWMRYFQRRARTETSQTLEFLAAMADCDPTGTRQPIDQTVAKGLLDEIDDALATGSNGSDALDERIDGLLNRAMERLCQTVVGGVGSGGKGCLVMNPLSFPRRLCVDVSGLGTLPEVAGPVRAVEESAGRMSAVVDVPAMGFAWIAAGGTGSLQEETIPAKGHRRKTSKKQSVVAEENILQNEYFRVTFDRLTGAIRSIFDYRQRTARLAQQIAMRMLPGGGDQEEDTAYSIMRADEVRVTASGELFGEIVCRGELVDRQADRLAGFRQTTRVWRGSRVIELDIELDVDRQPGDDPWNSYYAARFAWGDATADLYRSVNLTNVPTEAMQLESPHYVDIRSEGLRTTLLCGGLPYHRRFGLRKLDTLLVVRGETARRFRLGIGIDLPQPMPEALGLLAPQVAYLVSATAGASSGWLFHVDTPNVLATCWEPFGMEGRIVGFRVRLLETDGRETRLALRCFRRPVSAAKTPRGDTLPEELTTEDDRVSIRLGAYEWAEVEVRFAE